MNPLNFRNVSLRCGCHNEWGFKEVHSRLYLFFPIRLIEKRKKESERVFFMFFLIRAQIPSWELSLIRTLSPNIITLGNKVSTYEFWEHLSARGKHFYKLNVKYKCEDLQNMRQSWHRGQRMGEGRHQPNTWSNLRQGIMGESQWHCHTGVNLGTTK